MDELESRNTDPTTDLHLWTFQRRNPLGDGGSLPSDDPEWPSPLKEVRVVVLSWIIYSEMQEKVLLHVEGFVY